MCNAHATLSPRERDVLLWVYRGHTSIKIAEQLGIARGTVDIHINKILRKLGVASRVQAAEIFSRCPACQSTHSIHEGKV
jgi:DNA-binding CsgD family transcriptional regulator